jgi:hypothetical protein
MTSEERFLKECQDNADRITFVKVKAKWPYNYNDNMGYLVSCEGREEKLYFFFNDDGDLLEKQVVKE